MPTTRSAGRVGNSKSTLDASRKRIQNSIDFRSKKVKHSATSPSSNSVSASSGFDSVSRKAGRPSSRVLSFGNAEEYYQFEDDELLEEDILFAEEAIPDNTSDSSDNDSDPVRVLSEYVIYDRISGVLLPLPPHERAYGASGRARPKLVDGLVEVDTDGDVEDLDIGGQHVKLGKILEIWLDTEKYVEPEIWIKTAYAWYILECPAENYRPYLERVYVPHLLTCIIVENQGSENSTHEEISSFLASEGYHDTEIAVYAASILGRALTIDDFILDEAEVKENLKHIKRLRGERRLDGLKMKSQAASESHDTPFLTPTVGSIAQGLFYRTMIVADNHLDVTDGLKNVCMSDIPFIIHNENPQNIKWGKQIPGKPDFFQSVFLDGVEYWKGDAVAVEPDLALENASSHTWFCTILYFFEDNGYYFHARWFQHGSCVLAETANPQGLFLMDTCDNIHVSAILQKTRVRQLSSGDREPIVLNAKDIGSNSFHFSHKWDELEFVLSDPSLDDEAAIIQLSYQEPHMHCYPCALKFQRDLLGNCRKTSSILEIFGSSYHLHDFVYVKLEAQSLLAVAQITNLLASTGNSKLEVQLFNRAHSQEQLQHPEDMHELQPSHKLEIISALQLDGHCQVEDRKYIADLQEWLGGNDRFFIETIHVQQRPLKQCDICVTAFQSWAEIETKIKSHKMLKALDLFSGAGGLTTGMDLGGFVKTSWAVELSTSAAQTIEDNHPDITVYNHDINALLKHAVSVRDGKNPKPLKCLGDGSQLPPLPSPGEVDIIMGGPPCQGFSGMNRYKKADDIRHTLIASTLSYVEFYRPKYVLIENVTGILYSRLLGKQQGFRVVGGIEAGMVKFILRTLTSLGYQVQVRVLNAADFGSPQQRNRVIFWAAQFGISLPKWPKPTYIPKNGHNMTIRNVSGIGQVPLVSRNPSYHTILQEDGHEHAPFWSVTVMEAIDDLPPFHWSWLVKHDEAGSSGDQADIPSFVAVTSLLGGEAVGYNYPTLYKHSPRHPYQAWSRCGWTDHARVEDQVTASFASAVIKRTVNIPLHGSGKKVSGAELNETKDCFIRLDPDSQFKTTMTTISPGTKGTVLHPTQKRPLTVREYARAQGFPDKYRFLSVKTIATQIVKDQLRQIGNAVPVHLALALGKALGEARIQDELDETAFDGTENRDDTLRREMSEEL